MTEQTTPEPEPAPPADPAVRKPYNPPELVTHGTIQDLTQAMGEHPSDNAPVTPNGSTI